MTLKALLVKAETLQVAIQAINLPKRCQMGSQLGF